MTPLPKNKIIESVINSGALFELYYFLENDEPLYYTYKEQNILLSNNVYPLQKGKIFLAPTKEQSKFIDGRVLDLYEDIASNLKDYAVNLSKQPMKNSFKQLSYRLSQYEPKEVYDYLMESLESGELHNYAEFEDIDKLYDDKSKRNLKTYKFYLKGEFKSFGCTTNYLKKFNCYLYNKDKNYTNALKYFEKEVDISFSKLISKLSQKNMEM